MLYPLTFRPIFKDRVWGGRRLEQIYQKPLPPGVPIGESWEISDRPGDVSVIANGPLAGKDLHWVLENHPSDLLGKRAPHAGRFPLLIKILDAREKLSLQVHPPASKASALGGEPKTEMWFIADAEPGAQLYVGLRRGSTREEFEAKLKTGTVADCFHRLEVRAGDTMFLPSGRVHAIGSGLVIFEIQQNSDTTYRVFDWNRVGLDGKPRELHIPQSLASIDFEDFEPALAAGTWSATGSERVRQLVTDPLFEVSACSLTAGATSVTADGKMRILGLLKGRLTVQHPTQPVTLRPGDFCLLPFSLGSVTLKADADAEFLMVE
jgi:mannose-6-phosphate isomerase